MESPALIFGDFPKSIFKISSLCTGTKNTFGSPQKSGDFPKSICEISSLCSLTKNAFVPLQNYLWQAYKIKHFWRAVGSIPTPAMLKATQGRIWTKGPDSTVSISNEKRAHSCPGDQGG